MWDACVSMRGTHAAAEIKQIFSTAAKLIYALLLD
jgi:hypothetical protein